MTKHTDSMEQRWHLCTTGGMQIRDEDDNPISMEGLSAEQVIRWRNRARMWDRMVEQLSVLRAELGWRGFGPNDTEVFYCEKCKASNPDSSLMKHEDSCMYTLGAAMLADIERKEADGR